MPCLGQKQLHVIDSAKGVLKTERDDTNKVNTLNWLSGKLWRTGMYDTSITYSKNAESLAEKLNYQKGIASACRNIGIAYAQEGDLSKALEYFLKGLTTNKQAGNKSGIANSLSDIGNIYAYEVNYPKALQYDSMALAINIEMGNKNSIASAHTNMGLIYMYQGNYPRALENDFKALDVFSMLNDKEGCATSLSNIGIVYSSQGKYAQALEYYFKSLAINQELDDKTGIASNMDNIGIIYDDQQSHTKALEYYFKSLAINQEIGNKKGIATDFGNIGASYYTQNNYTKALEYYNKSLPLYSDMEDNRGVSLTYGNMGDVYGKRANEALARDDIAGSDSLYKKALGYDKNALALSKEIGDKDNIAINFSNIGGILTKQKKYAAAKSYLDSSLILSKDIGDKENIKGAYTFMTVLDSSTGNYKAALQDYKKCIIYKDSLVNEENTKKTVQAEMNYDFEQKQAIEKAGQEKKDAIAAQERNKQKLIRNSFITGFIFMLVLAFFIFRGYLQKQKANKIITQQKEEVERQKILVEQQKMMVEQKNKDILDSITYAKRLQDAILPPMSLIKQYLPESFVLYKPKDIVAGDFYWMEKVGDTILIAAADCTGHGVPGALVSVVCSNALNRTVKEFHITEPGKILDKVRDLVLETFEKSDDNVQDGMDVSIAAISYTPMANGFIQMQWSGANNSLWFVHSKEMREIAADKQPIGKYYKSVPFNTHNVTLQKGDTLYLFTDGYADQFGGEKGKKFKYKQLQEKLLAISHQSLAEQKNILETTLETWRGGLEQVDDILVMGIKV